MPTSQDAQRTRDKARIEELDLEQALAGIATVKQALARIDSAIRVDELLLSAESSNEKKRVVIGQRLKNSVLQKANLEWYLAEYDQRRQGLTPASLAHIYATPFDKPSKPRNSSRAYAIKEAQALHGHNAKRICQELDRMAAKRKGLEVPSTWEKLSKDRTWIGNYAHPKLRNNVQTLIYKEIRRSI